MSNLFILGISVLTFIGVFFSSWGFAMLNEVDRNAAFIGALFFAVGVGTLVAAFLFYRLREKQSR